MHFCRLKSKLQILQKQIQYNKPLHNLTDDPMGSISKSRYLKLALLRFNIIIIHIPMEWYKTKLLFAKCYLHETKFIL